jgi:hypothetical protein
MPDLLFQLHPKPLVFMPTGIECGVQDNGQLPIIIADNGDESLANAFCFGTFANKIPGVMYNDLTGNFPFMLYDGNICFILVYHYYANAILAIPIADLNTSQSSMPTRIHSPTSLQRASNQS